MEDTAILDLYWARDERAITETQKSYGKYCYSIAYHILHDREDTEECLNDTWMRAWNAIPPKNRTVWSFFWEQLPAICRLIDGRGVMHRSGETARWIWHWMNWRNAFPQLTIRKVLWKQRS